MTIWSPQRYHHVDIDSIDSVSTSNINIYMAMSSLAGRKYTNKAEPLFTENILNESRFFFFKTKYFYEKVCFE